MKKVLSNFRELLIGNKTVCIACIENRTEWTISPKDNVEQFIEGIINACNDAYGINVEETEIGECKILKAEAFDYYYAIELVISIPTEDNKPVEAEIYLYHANKF